MAERAGGAGASPYDTPIRRCGRRQLLWGTATKKSDKDVIVVVKNGTVVKGKVQTHARSLDVAVIEEAVLAERVRAFQFPELLCPFVPSTLTLGASPLRGAALVVEPFRLKAATMERVEHDRRRIDRAVAKGGLMQACKTCIHAIRCVLLTTELAMDGSMSSFDVVNDLTWRLKAGHASAETLASELLPRLEEGMGRFMRVVEGAGGQDRVGK